MWFLGLNPKTRAGGHLEQQMTSLPVIKRQPRSTVPVKGTSLCSSAPAPSPSPWQGERHKAMAGGCCTGEQCRTPLASGWSQKRGIGSFYE